MGPGEGQEIVDGADGRTASGCPCLRQHEHIGTPDASGRRIEEVTDGSATEDSILSRSAGTSHAYRPIDLTLEKVVIRSACHGFEQAARDDHPAARVAGVFAWHEECP